MVGWDGGWGRHEGWWHDGAKASTADAAAVAWSDNGPQPMESFSEGDEVSGTVSNVTDFGVFVNFGCARDGLLSFGKWYDDNDPVQKGDWLENLIISRVDLARNRISLRYGKSGPAEGGHGRGRGATARRGPAGAAPERPRGRGDTRRGRERDGATPLSALKPGADVQGRIRTVAAHGLYVDVGAVCDGFLPWRSATVGREDARPGEELRSLSVETVDEELGRFTLRGPAAFGGDAWGGWRAGAWEDSTWRPEQGWDEEGQEGADAWRAEGQQEAATQSWTSSRPVGAAPDSHRKAKPREAKGASASSREAGAAAAVSRPAPRTREELVRAVFGCFDIDGDGWLNAVELRPFAAHTGFSGTDADWVEEYRLLCEESKPRCNPANGIDETTFATMVNDDSQDGCYCTDAELTEMLGRGGSARAEGARGAGRREPAASAARAEACPGGEGEGAEEARGARRGAGRGAAGAAAGAGGAPAAPGDRAQLKELAFDRLDANKTGCLGSADLRSFAKFTGFDGTDAEWDEEYQILCRDNGRSPAEGVDRATWRRLVDDSSESGCFCSDDELRGLLAELPSVARSPPAAAPAPESGTSLREVAKRNAFARLDTDGDGRLRCAELRRLGEVTGFDGTDGEWAEEYELLCGERGHDPAQGLDFEAFSAMVDDETESGCYCTDAELAAVGPAASAPSVDAGRGESAAQGSRGQEAPRSGGRPPAGAAAAPPPSSLTREELKGRAFGLLDADGDGRLSSAEFRPFADQSGFEGSDEDWAEEFALLCKSMGERAAAGLDKPCFMELVDDESDEGCYMSHEELVAFLEKLAVSGPSAEARPEAPPPSAAPAAPPPRSTGGARDAPRGEAGPRGGPAGGRAGDAGRGAGGPAGAAGAPADPWAAQADPWTAQADPWAAQADPWSTPGAKRATEKRRQETVASEAESKEGWDTWRDAGKPGASTDPSKPAMDAQKLLEASRAAIAARRAKEQEQAAQREHEMGDPGAAAQASSSSSSGIPQRPELARGPKMVSMPAALASIGAAMAHIALGDGSAGRELVSAVLCAPCVPHALAVASNALRSLLQGRVEEAQLLLRVDELHLSPLEGDAALLRALTDLARSLGTQGAPFLVRTLLAALVKVDDKQASTRAAAARATEEIASSSDPFAFEALLPSLRAALDAKRSPAMKLQALRLLSQCQASRHGEEAVAQRLPQLLPAAAALLVDTNGEVRTAAGDAVEKLLDLCGNSDLEPHLKDVYGCYKGSKDVSAFVPDLAEVVFVQQVEARALAVVVPVLTKGLKSRSMRTQRQACVIAANMCKLVSAVTDVQPFAPQLLPLLKRIHEEASDPDVRDVAGRAHSSLTQVADADAAGGVRLELKSELAAAAAVVRPGTDGTDGPAPCPAPVRDTVLDYAAMLSSGLGQARVREEEWERHIAPLLEPLLGPDRVTAAVEKLQGIAGRLAVPRCPGAHLDVKGDEAKEMAEEPGEELDILCDCTITLACGAATLLSGARLRLARGHVYGLVGANDSGKSSLLRAIHDRRVVGFPPAGTLVTALVEHGVGEQPPECDLTPAEYLLADPAIQALALLPTAVTGALRKMGFDEGGRLKKPIRTLSGGWRMKLGLVRAMLQEPDVLLLDEPTGHLDAAHISWLVDYINDLKTDKLHLVTALIVSHDTPFLDRVCTDIVHVCDARLRAFRGNLSQFLEQAPGVQVGSAAADEERPLAAFVLPAPGPLEAVKSRGRRFLYLEDVFYTYPGGSAPAVRRASVECSLRSRVAIVGPNGAGKSTLAGLVVGELAPDLGTAWRHPNLRVAFVAQHAFHHLERHMELTATQYILRRFHGSEDHEAGELRAAEAECDRPKAYRLSGDRLALCDPLDERAVHPEAVLDRRQRGRLGYEYEVRWRGVAATTWLSGAQLASMGHMGLARREDEKQAAQRSLSERPLTTPGVEAHLAGFGLDAEEASHRRLSALSNGQRARVVLGAATWLAPHLLVLDEPTNYLDRAGLTALVAGLQNFGGGVMVISHTTAFLDEVCTERWVMEQGALRREGAPPGGAEDAEAAGGAGPARGISAAAAAVKAAKERKRQKRMKDLRRKNGEQVSDDEEEWWEELQKKASVAK